MLTIIDEFTSRCLAIVVARRLTSDDVLHCLVDLFVTHGPPEHIRSDDGPHGPCGAQLAWTDRRQDTLHRARKPVGERLYDVRVFWTVEVVN